MPDTMAWNDLACRDVDAAKAFYTTLLGWETSENPMSGGGVYTLFSNGGRANGGVWDFSSAVPLDVPAHWLTWFNVSDVEEVTAKVAKLGGSVRQPPRDSSEGRMAIVADPAGAAFGIVAANQIDDQPER